MIDRRVWRKLTRKREIPENLDELERVFYQQQIYFREIVLEGKWWRCCSGKVLAFSADDDTPVILSPGFSDYTFIHPRTGRRCNVSTHGELLKKEAFALRYPLPKGELTIRSFIGHALRQLSVFDGICSVLACLGVMLLTMFTPYACKLLFDEVIPSGDAAQLAPIAVLLFSAAAGLVMVQISRNFLVVRMKDKIEYTLQSSLMTRLLSLPTTFFKQYSPGEISNRALSVVRFSTQLTEDMLSTILTLLFTVILFIQFFTYGGPLLYTGIVVMALYMLTIYIQYACRKKVQDEANASASKLTGLIYNLAGGAQKIRTNGAEIRAFRHWAEAYEPSDPDGSRYPALFNYSNSISYNFRMVPLIVTMIAAWHYGLGLSDYIAYCSVLTIASEAILEFQRITKVLAQLAPEIKLCTPLLEAQLETGSGSMFLREVSGNIEIRGLKFRYNEDMPYIFDNLNLNIHAGEYVAIVGVSGCGKSTLMRLMLGFEKAESGSIFYDEHNLEDVNLPSLRRYCMSICLQGGQLMEGTIRDNILFGSGNYTEEEVWKLQGMPPWIKTSKPCRTGWIHPFPPMDRAFPEVSASAS
jgi:ABC-type bacteriocin/lantibiotic exporters, contain an N-terminal double-glycine peptidase domain